LKAVADASSLIYPAKVSSFWKTMRDTFQEILIPRAALDEILKGKEIGSSDVPVIQEGIREGWIVVLNIRAKSKMNFPDDLGEGEKETITLALKLGRKVDWLLMDDELAAERARSLGLVVRPASYLPIHWRINGVLKSSKALEMLNELVQGGYRLNTKDYVEIRNIILETD
jgi:predicted nucleic acid-binding protein